MPYSLHLLDLLAISWFFLGWTTYNWVSRRRYLRSGATSLSKLSRDYRKAWMLNMLDRDYQIFDATLLGLLIKSVSFFTSGAILIIAGLAAALGAAAEVLEITTQVPYAVDATVITIQIKVLILISVFIYVFFKLAWSLRQYNFAVVMMGAAALEFEQEGEKKRWANKMGIIIDRGGVHFNEGMRGFEFGLAYLGWFVHPVLFIAATTLVLLVLFRREFRSNVLRAMQEWDQNI
ncbi:MAG: DUF599 family protein [Proteobacteria bacterium]|nr:DUF599 family protein [Pseudomonadota bacterium]